ncbi:hypothetical protein RJT34_12627 [Clitoria ternatea]|uniref:Uncharacterized protein n=1 Tax=Clitoria ternatea TaxID=43366 RepID=A0AAN9JPR6_CLITE
MDQLMPSRSSEKPCTLERGLQCESGNVFLEERLRVTLQAGSLNLRKKYRLQRVPSRLKRDPWMSGVLKRVPSVSLGVSSPLSVNLWECLALGQGPSTLKCDLHALKRELHVYSVSMVE